MLCALLVAACLAPAATDWVEISQQHYRKPARPHAASQREEDPVRPTYYPHEESRLPHAYPEEEFHTHHNPVRFTPNYEETSRFENIPKGNRIYLNHSLSEHSWNQYKYPPSSNVKRIDDYSLTVRPNITPEFSLEIFEPVAEKPVLVTRNKPGDRERVPVTIERVPSKGSVKRVQLPNTPVKSPTVTNAVSPIRRNDIKQYGSSEENGGTSDRFEIKSDILNNEESTSLNHEKHVFSVKNTPIWNNDKMTTTTLGWPASEPSMPSRKHTQTKYIAKSDTENENNNNSKHGTMIKNITAYEENRDSDTTTKVNAIETKVSENIDSSADRSGENLLDKATNKIKNTEVEKENVECTENTNCNTKDNSNRNAGHNNEKRNEDIKVNTMENVMKFIKMVADTISKNTNRGVNGKVKYLNDLKETLLCGIRERIEATWPDDVTAAAPARRRSRSAMARGHVEFPSSESALMTISFLTFAVFLIKLVLQVIQTYKNKTMMVAPLVVATAGRAVRKLSDSP